MTTSLLRKFVLTPVLLSATVFAALSVPLMIFGKQPITIQLQEEPVFSGKLRDISSPYLGLAAVLSLGTGFAAVAVSGWRRSTDKSSLVEAQLLDLAKNIQQKETQLEALKISGFQLEKSVLKDFVDDVPRQTSHVVLPNPANSFVEPLIITTQELQSQIVLPYQSYNDFLTKDQAMPISVNVQALAPKEVAELHTQLQQIMASVQIVVTAIESRAMSEKIPPVAQSWVVKDTVF